MSSTFRLSRPSGVRCRWSSTGTATPPTASATATAAAKAPGFELFSGAPSFEGKTKPKAFMGVSYDLPTGWKSFDIRSEQLIAGLSNPPMTVKSRLWLNFDQDMSVWATAADMAKLEKEKTAKVFQGGKQIDTVPIPSACEEAVFKTTNVHHSEVQWVGEPKDATFGTAKRPGAVLEAKDPKGKWTIYCLRVSISDKIGMFGAVGFRADRPDSESNGKALVHVVKSFRAEGS
jgi:hypothetical protein